MKKDAPLSLDVLTGIVGGTGRSMAMGFSEYGGAELPPPVFKASAAQQAEIEQLAKMLATHSAPTTMAAPIAAHTSSGQGALPIPLEFGANLNVVPLDEAEITAITPG